MNDTFGRWLWGGEEDIEVEKEFKVEQKRVLNNVEVLGLSEIIQLTMTAKGVFLGEKIDE